MGNLDPAAVLRMGDPATVRTATRELMAECAAYPNFVPSSGCDMPPLTPWENINAFFRAVEDFYEGAL
jgi:uroporphyrinogen decarboxylase